METQVQIISPEKVTSISQEISEAKSLMIVTRDDYGLGQLYMEQIKKRIKMLEEERMAQTRPLDESKKRIINFFKPHLDKLEEAKSYLNRIMVTWADDQERKRREEERRLQEEARKRAEEEALKAALEAEAAGEKEEAEQIISEPVYVPPVKVVSEVPKSKESHIRETWSCEIVNLLDLVKGILDDKVSIQAIEPNMTFLNTQARAYRGLLNIPGVRAISKKTQI